MKGKNSIAVVLIIIFLFLSTNLVNAITTINPFEKENNNKNWTVLYYLCGDSNVNDYVKPMLDRLSEIKSTENLNILILTDTKSRHDSKLIYIDEFGEKVYLNDIFGWPDEVDTSSLNTLELFCTQMMNAFPANHYALIIFASGGTGWTKYCIPDDSDGVLGHPIPDFANSFKNIYEETEKKIDVLFVSCGMGMIEIAYEFSPYINYMVATQDCLAEKDLINRFTDAVWDLKNNSSLSPEEFASKAPERLNPEPFYYFESYRNYLPVLNKILNLLPFKAFHTVVHNPSWAVVNHSTLEDLSVAIDDLVNILILYKEDEVIYKAIKDSRNSVREFGKCYAKFGRSIIVSTIYYRFYFNFMAYRGFIDLYDFVEKLKENIENNIIIEKCNITLEKFQKTIPAIKRVEDDPSNGLSIYFPSHRIFYNKSPTFRKLDSEYENLRFAKDFNWDEFLKCYLKI